MLASSSIFTPSRVSDSAVFRRFSLERSISRSDLRSRYSSSTRGSGLTITTPRVPSMITSSLSRITERASRRPTMAGMAMLRDRIAVWEVAPPTSVMNEAKRCSLKVMTSAGDRSWATMIWSSSRIPLADFIDWRPGRPISSLITRSTTWRTSARRSRR